MCGLMDVIEFVMGLGFGLGGGGREGIMVRVELVVGWSVIFSCFFCFMGVLRKKFFLFSVRVFDGRC